MIANLKLCDGHLTIRFTFRDKQRRGWSQIQKLAKRRACLGPSPALQPLPHENQHHDDRGRLEIEIGAMVPMSAHSGHRLQEQQDNAVEEGRRRAERDQGEHVQLP